MMMRGVSSSRAAARRNAEFELEMRRGAKSIYGESASNYWEAVNITVRTPKVWILTDH